MRTQQRRPWSELQVASNAHPPWSELQLASNVPGNRKSPSDISLCSWKGGEQHGKDAGGVRGWGGGRSLLMAAEGGYKDNFLSALIALTVCRLLPSRRSLIEITCT